MRKPLGVAALMLAFCCPTLAGEIPNPPAPAGEMPTPPALAGEIPNPPAPTAEDGIIGDNTDPLTQIVLTLLASVLP
jgi:hypothetical protein